jgi:hypothetical protein
MTRINQIILCSAGPADCGNSRALDLLLLICP